MKKMTRSIVCVVVALCVVLVAGTALAAPGRRGGSVGGGQNTDTTVQATAPKKAQRNEVDCPRLAGGGNDGGAALPNCQSDACPRLNGGTCAYPDCAFSGQRPQDGTGVRSGKNGNAENNGGDTSGSQRADGRRGGTQRGNAQRDGSGQRMGCIR